MGDPAAYLIQGAVIALRKADSCLVTVKPGTPEAADSASEAMSAPSLAGCESSF